MSVIIRLQNLPWSANALDIRKFFKGLSIPEGGVHIVGGEMGDAFIAFSTDEDARQAMMHDRESIKEVQVRLLLSSRAEMQKVIETARLNSLSVLQQMAARATVPAVKTTPTPMPMAYTTVNKTTDVASTLAPTPSFLAYQQQAGITLAGSPLTNDFDTKSSSKTEEQTSMRRADRSREHDRRRSPSRDPREYRRRREESRSRSRERERERGRNRDKDRDSSNRRRDRSRRSHSRESRDRSNERSRGRNYNRSRRSESRERNRDSINNRNSSFGSSSNANANELDKQKTNWGMQATNAYQTNTFQATLSNAYSTSSSNKENTAAADIAAKATLGIVAASNSPEVIIPAFQSYTSTISNNYSINLYGGNSNSNSSDAPSVKPFVLQNPYTTAQQQQTINSTVESKLNNVPMLSNTITTPAVTPATASNDMKNYVTSEQEPIAFAKTNPYEQMYPSLFAQAAAQQMPRSNATAAQRNSPNVRGSETNAYPESSSIKISNMCTNTNYSDLRKFFSGLFIPHNGIKMVNDKQGMRTGVAFIQFSRSSSVSKAMTRNNTLLKSNQIHIEVVPDEEFNETEDGFRPGRFDRSNYNDGDSERHRYDGNYQSGNDSRGQSRKSYEEPLGPFSVLYVEELPPLTTEQDLMKMFSSYTLYDILLLPSAENRREYVAHVKFSLPEDAKAALEDKSKHMIGYRKVRVYPGKEEEMEKAKEKLRLANEQLRKEEEEANRVAAAEAAEKAEIEAASLMNECPMVIEDDDEENKQDVFSNRLSSGLQFTNRDPRLIPSLLEMPTTKPPCDDEDKDNNNRGLVPADPRLRARTRPSRFDANDVNIDAGSNALNNNNMLDPMLSSSRNSTNPYVQMNNGNGTNKNNNQFDNMSMQQNTMPMMPFQRNSQIDNNFLLLYNCPYSTRQNDIGELFNSANIMVKHIEILYNERGAPNGEFIVEVTNPRDADLAFSDFNNTQLRGRNLRVRKITPQDIADRLKKPFMNCIPGGGGGGSYNFNNNNNPGGMMMNMSGGGMRNNSGSGGGGMPFNSNNNYKGDNSRGNRSGSPIRRGRRGPGSGASMNHRGGRTNYNDDDQSEDDDNVFNNDNDDFNKNGRNNKKDSLDNENCNIGSGGGGMPDKFTRPHCVVAMENVPYKADSDDILRFFSGFNLRPDDIIRRYNDDGSATGDARVAFPTPGDAQAAYGKCNRKQIFNRTIYLNII